MPRFPARMPSLSVVATRHRKFAGDDTDSDATHAGDRNTSNQKEH
jgi:hypothetical protein